LELLDERDVVALEQDLANFAPLLWRILLGQRDLDRVVNDKVHELVETSELALDAHAEVLVEPYRNGGTGLEELEDEVDWGQEDASKLVSR
jgi:hypothetical protein